MWNCEETAAEPLIPPIFYTNAHWIKHFRIFFCLTTPPITFFVKCYFLNSKLLCTKAKNWQFSAIYRQYLSCNKINFFYNLIILMTLRHTKGEHRNSIMKAATPTFWQVPNRNTLVPPVIYITTNLIFNIPESKLIANIMA